MTFFACGHGVQVCSSGSCRRKRASRSKPRRVRRTQWRQRQPSKPARAGSLLCFTQADTFLQHKSIIISWSAPRNELSRGSHPAVQERTADRDGGYNIRARAATCRRCGAGVSRWRGVITCTKPFDDTAPREKVVCVCRRIPSENTVQYNTIQYNTIQYKTTQHNRIQ